MRMAFPNVPHSHFCKKESGWGDEWVEVETDGLLPIRCKHARLRSDGALAVVNKDVQILTLAVPRVASLRRLSLTMPEGHLCYNLCRWIILARLKGQFALGWRQRGRISCRCCSCK